MTTKQFVGILLAGGKSRRYGSPKAFAKMDRKQFYEISYANLRTVCDDIVIVTREEYLSRFPSNLTVITDEASYVGFGPLAGIYAAMNYFEAANYVVLPCDMPLLRGEILKRLIELHTQDVTVVTTDGYVQPLVSVWNVNVKREIERSLQEKRLKMTDVLECVNTMYVASEKLTDTPYVFMNVNTPREDKEMRKWQKSQMR